RVVFERVLRHHGLGVEKGLGVARDLVAASSKTSKLVNCCLPAVAPLTERSPSDRCVGRPSRQALCLPNAPLTGAEASQRVSIQLDPQAWPLRQGDDSIFDPKLFLHQLLAQKRVAQFGRKVLNKRTMRRSRGQMGRGGDADPRLPAVGD